MHDNFLAEAFPIKPSDDSRRKLALLVATMPVIVD